MLQDVRHPGVVVERAMSRLVGVISWVFGEFRAVRLQRGKVVAVYHAAESVDTLAGFADAPLMPVSSHTGQGMSALQAFLAQKAGPRWTRG